MSGRNITDRTTKAMPLPLIWNRPQLRFIEGAGEGGGTGTTQQAQQTSGGGFTAITTQEDLDKVLGPRLAREREKFKDYAQLKTDSEELAKLREANASDQDKALNAARQEGRDEVTKVLAAERVRTALTTALQGRVPNPVALLDLDRAVFVKGDGADSDAIKQWVEQNSTAATATTSTTTATNTPDPSQGGTNTSGSQEAGRAAYERRHPKPQ